MSHELVGVEACRPLLAILQAGLAQQLSSLESTLATSNGDLAHQYGAGGGGDDASALRARMAQQQRELSLKTDECLQLKQQLSDARAEAQQLLPRLHEGPSGSVSFCITFTVFYGVLANFSVFECVLVLYNARRGPAASEGPSSAGTSGLAYYWFTDGWATKWATSGQQGNG